MHCAVETATSETETLSKNFETKARCKRHASCAVFGRMRLILWRHVLFWCVWYGLRSSKIELEEWVWCVNIETGSARNADQTHALKKRIGRMPCAYSLRPPRLSKKQTWTFVRFAKSFPNFFQKCHQLLRGVYLTNLWLFLLFFYVSYPKDMTESEQNELRTLYWAMFTKHPKFRDIIGSRSRQGLRVRPMVSKMRGREQVSRLHHCFNDNNLYTEVNMLRVPSPLAVQVCTFHDGCKQGVDQQIFNRKLISRKITHPQSWKLQAKLTGEKLKGWSNSREKTNLFE